MAYTLWRGDQLLGELFWRERSPEMLSGTLALADGVADFAGVMQVQLGDPSRDRISQYPVEPLTLPFPESQQSEHSKRVSLRRVSGGEAQGVADELQLTIRDEAGEVLPAPMITVTEFRFPPELAASISAKFPGPGVGRTHAWLVSAVLDSVSPRGS